MEVNIEDEDCKPFYKDFEANVKFLNVTNLSNLTTLEELFVKMREAMQT